MSRYIDAEAVKEEFTCKGDEWINNIIDSAPSIDIVFCKECKHCEYVGKKLHLWCDEQECYMYADDYCSYGERESE